MAYFSTKPPYLTLAALLLAACGGDDGRETGFSGSSPTSPSGGFTATTSSDTEDPDTATSSTTAATTTDATTSAATDTDSCPLGQQGCACDQGACDQGLACQGGLCQPAAPACGDGKVDPGEQCDDGEDNADTNACTAACELAICGDGLIHEGVELCDDANTDDTDECTNACQLAACGDGIVGPGEQCDDGNQIDTDACTNACTNAVCGDGVVQSGVEECDDGNQVDTDACTNACQDAVCGDGIVHAGVEECDDGNDNQQDGCAMCKSGVIAFGELRPALKCSSFVNNGADYRQYCFVLKGVTLCVGQTGGGLHSCTEIPGGLRFTFDLAKTWPMRFNNNAVICANYHPNFVANLGLALGYSKVNVTQTKTGNNCTRTYIDANGSYASVAGDANQAQIYTVDFTN